MILARGTASLPVKSRYNTRRHLVIQTPSPRQAPIGPALRAQETFMGQDQTYRAKMKRRRRQLKRRKQRVKEAIAAAAKGKKRQEKAEEKAS
jgi:hypothetical protein